MTGTCDYCGLPASGPPGESESFPIYCCLGCRIAAEIVASPSVGSSRTAMRLGLAVFFSMNVMVCSLVLWSWDAYTIDALATTETVRELLRLLALVMTTPVLVLLGGPLAENVWQQLRQRRLTTDILLLVGVLVAFTYSVLSILAAGEHIYFEVVCMILLAVTLGRWIEATGKEKAMRSLQTLQAVLPASANVVQEQGGVASVPLERVVIGDAVRVLPGDRIPLDGTIVAGAAFVDEQLVSGESEALRRGSGDPVFGGTLNLDGCLDIRVSTAPSDGVIPRLVAAVREAATSKSHVELLADRAMRVFVPFVLLMVVIVFSWHLRSDGIRTALMSSMSVALIACPCALAIATPLALWAALGAAASQQVVFRKSDDLLTLADIDTVCLDKTGTLTGSDRELVDEQYDADPDQAHRVTAALVAATQHPLVDTLRGRLPSHVQPAHLQTASTIPGGGVHGRISFDERENSVPAALGSAEFCKSLGVIFPEAISAAETRAAQAGHSLVMVAWGGVAQACFAFHEQVRAGVMESVEQLKQMGLAVELLTGDQPVRAQQLADGLGIRAFAKLLPEEKLEHLSALQSAGHQVAMVGDGINDAPALSRANIGIALGCGVEVSRDAADVCLMSSELSALPHMVKLAKQTKRTVKRNLAWAFGYNMIGMGLAATGRLNPILAATAMVLSSSFVIAESLRLSLFRSEQVKQPNGRVRERVQSEQKASAFNRENDAAGRQHELPSWETAAR